MVHVWFPPIWQEAEMKALRSAERGCLLNPLSHRSRHLSLQPHEIIEPRTVLRNAFLYLSADFLCGPQRLK